MSKSLKYVTEFEFPADKGYTGSCAKEPAKAYAKGGSCSGYAKGGSCGDSGKMMKAKGGKVVERATGEKYPSREAMVRHESLETPRMQREEVVKRQVVKAPQNRRRGEPMIKPKERGETLLAQRQQQASPLNAIAQANIPGVAMKKGGKCYADGGKVKKMALGGSSSIRPGERQGSSPVAQARPPAPAARLAPQKQPVASARPVAPVARLAPQKQPVASQSQLRSAVQNPQQKGIQGGLQAGMKVPTQSPMQASMSGQAPSGNMQGGTQGNMRGGTPPRFADIPQGGQKGYATSNTATGMPQTPPQVNSPAMVQSRMYPGAAMKKGGSAKKESSKKS